MRTVLKRETLHFTAGTAVGLAVLYSPRLTILIIFGVMTSLMVIFEATRFSAPSLNRRFVHWFPFIVRKAKGEERKITGTTYFLLASLVTVFAFPRHIAATAILFSALGDPTASVVGTWLGRTKFWGKSLEGHLACLVICLAIGVILASTLEGLSMTVAVIGAIAATALQATNLPLDDNVTIPIGSALVMWALAFLVAG
ncbi:MAG: hypothetical protein HYX81_02895 [Chloroflexi bacterium]|nr:hypothetical protein [Chloroflexota bacterium]